MFSFLGILPLLLTLNSHNIYDSYIILQSEIEQSAIETESNLEMKMEIEVFDDFKETLTSDQREIFTEEFEETLLEKCMETNISPWLVIAIIKNESRFNPLARAYDGSAHYGLFQLSEYYFADEIALTESQDIFEPVANITVGIDNLHNIQEKIKYYSCITNTNIPHPLEALTVLSHNVGMGTAVPLFQSGYTNAFTQTVISDWQGYIKKYGEIDCREVLTGSHLGYWIEFNGQYVCSDCNKLVDVVSMSGIPLYHYCPYCGKEKNLNYIHE